jgi:hypothetical protein
LEKPTIANHALVKNYFAVAKRIAATQKDRAFQASSPKTRRGRPSRRPFFFAPRLREIGGTNLTARI